MALFQNSVLNKYLNELDNSKIATLYTQYSEYFLNPDIQQNIRESKEEQFQEGFLRELFVKVLGYTINPNPNYNLTTELKNESGAKKADGAIMKGGKAIGVIELKSTTTKDLESIRQQAFDYKANHSECIYVVTSNFEKLRFYIDNAVDYEEFDLFTLTLSQFKLLYLCLNVDNILGGVPKSAKIASLVKEENVTKKLYADYSVFKENLFNNIISTQDNLDLADTTDEKEAKLILFKKTQKLMDRFLFIFFSEDRGLIPPNTISTILTEWEKLKSLDAYRPLYDRFKRHFDYINEGWKGDNYEVFAYNGGLFLPDPILDNITIDDEVLYEHTKVLTKYDFESEVDVNILGHIFEHSLTEIETVSAELEGQEIDKKKTKRKKDGVFYTPKYITKYIVDNTVGKLCEEKKQELGIEEEDYLKGKKNRRKETIKKLEDMLITYRDWLLGVTIVDPACGSGAFLNQALEFLIAEHRWIDEMTAKLFGGGLVFQDVENSILENNLYGVDINEESVEIAKLSLWLRTAQKGRKLTSLNNNIKCGNSIIDDPAVAGDKAFKWEEEFPKVFAKGGFDVVIGNPPYVRSRDEILNDYKEYYFENYQCIFEKPNLYLLFMEKGFSLLRKNSRIGFIVPNSWLGMESAKKIRYKILSQSKLEYLISLIGKSFEGVGVETVIYIIKNLVSNKHETKYAVVELDDVIIPNLHSIDQSIWEKNRDSIIDIVSSGDEIGVIKKIKSLEGIIDDFYDVRVGMQAYEKGKGIPKQSAEDVKKHIYDYRYKYDNTTFKYFEGKDIDRYSSNWSGSWLKWGEWLSQPKEFKQFSKPRILIREITGKFPHVIKATYLEDIYLNNKSIINILEKDKKYSLFTLLGILNSKLIGFYHKRQAVKGNRTLFPKAVIKDIKNYPITNFKSKKLSQLELLVNNNLKVHEKLFEICNNFTSLLQSKFDIDKLSRKLENWHELDFKQFLAELKKKKVKLSLSEEAEWMDYFNEQKAEAQELKAKIDATDNEIDHLVYKLYDLTYDEVLIVDPETPITREGY